VQTAFGAFLKGKFASGWLRWSVSSFEQSAVCEHHQQDRGNEQESRQVAEEEAYRFADHPFLISSS
jgi:hypothetical protein